MVGWTDLPSSGQLITPFLFASLLQNVPLRSVYDTEITVPTQHMQGGQRLTTKHLQGVSAPRKRIMDAEYLMLLHLVTKCCLCSD